jgi:hypothetical protein
MLSDWVGEKPSDEELKRMYFEFISRENRSNYNKKFKEKLKRIIDCFF